MFNLKVIVFLLGCKAIAGGSKCMKHIVDGEWESYGDCRENQEIFKSIVDEIRAKAEIANKVTSEIGVTSQNVVTQATETSSPVSQEETTTSPGPDWRKSGDRFYKCFNDEMANYEDANSSCIRYGGRLAAEVLRDPDVAGYIATRCFNDSSLVMRPWIGFDEIAEEGQWKWSDGGAMNPVTTQWRIGEPNNNGGTDEDCGNIWNVSSTKLLLNDERCYVPLTYICEV